MVPKKYIQVFWVGMLLHVFTQWETFPVIGTVYILRNTEANMINVLIHIFIRPPPIYILV